MTEPKKNIAGLTAEFSSDTGKQTQWNAFLRKNKLDGTASLETVIDSLREFFQPIIIAVNKQEKFQAKWISRHWTF